jgi:hypothetical protein
LDPKVAYWTAAWINMVGIVALAAAGLARVHHGRYHGGAEEKQERF